MGRRVSSPVLIGRGAELAELESAMARAIAGGLSVLIVAGEAGVGKTRLVEQFADGVADGAGFRVWRGRCLPFSDGASPYAPIVDVFRAAIAGLGRDRFRELAGAMVPRLARLLPEIGDATTLTTASTQDSSQARQWHDLVWLWNRLVDRPTVAVIEDVHWADRSTGGLLSLLFNGVKGPLLLICTYRDDELPPSHAMRSLLAEWYRAGVVRVQLERLDEAGTLAQIAAITGGEPDPKHGGDLFRRSGGNPFFVEELLAADGLREGALPDDLRDVLLLRVRQLPSHAAQAIRAVALAGYVVRHAILAEVLRLSHDELVAALHAAIDNHILVAEADWYRFRHALVAEAVMAEMLPGERIGLHRALAEALDGRGSPAEAAGHWFAAGEADRALAATIEAGLAAVEVFALAEAYGHFRRALDLWPDAPEGRALAPLDLAGLHQHTAETAFLLYDLEEALILVQQALHHVDERLDPMRAGQLYALRGRCMVAACKPTADTLSAYESAIRLVPDEPTPERARVLSSYAAMVMVTSRHAEAAALAREAVDISRQAGAPQGEVRGLATLGNCLVLLGRPEEGIARLRDALEIATTAGDPGLLIGAYINLSDALYNVGQFVVAAGTALHGLEVLEPYSVQRGHYNVLVANALESLFWLGRWDELAERLSGFGVPGDDKSVHTFLWVPGAAFHTAQGQFDAARQALDACGEAVSGANLEVAGHVLAAEAEWQLWRGDPRAARAAVERAVALLGDESSHGPLMARLLARGARAHADLAIFYDAGDAAGLARLRERIGRLPQAPHHTHLAEAHLSLAQAELTRLGDGAPAAWDRAAELWRALGSPYPMAYSNWRQAEALVRRGGQRQKAAHCAGVAHETASRLGAAPLCREIEALAKRARLEWQQPAAVPLADEVPFGLTSREVDVLRLLALGQTNRQIAGALHIAERTVENHISSILTKMEVSGRGAAAAIARRLGL